MTDAEMGLHSERKAESSDCLQVKKVIEDVGKRDKK